MTFFSVTHRVYTRLYCHVIRIGEHGIEVQKFYCFKCIIISLIQQLSSLSCINTELSTFFVKKPWHFLNSPFINKIIKTSAALFKIPKGQ